MRFILLTMLGFSVSGIALGGALGGDSLQDYNKCCQKLTDNEKKQLKDVRENYIHGLSFEEIIQGISMPELQKLIQDQIDSAMLTDNEKDQLKDIREGYIHGLTYDKVNKIAHKGDKTPLEQKITDAFNRELTDVETNAIRASKACK